MLVDNPLPTQSAQKTERPKQLLDDCDTEEGVLPVKVAVRADR
jgi:hypothetical protein